MDLGKDGSGGAAKRNRTSDLVYPTTNTVTFRASLNRQS